MKLVNTVRKALVEQDLSEELKEALNKLDELEKTDNETFYRLKKADILYALFENEIELEKGSPSDVLIDDFFSYLYSKYEVQEEAESIKDYFDLYKERNGIKELPWE